MRTLRTVKLMTPPVPARFPEAMMFGAMMSALNPIPTLRQYKRLGVVRTVTHNHLQGGYRTSLVV